MPLGSAHFRQKVESFLASCGLRFEPMDAWYGIQADDGSLLAGAGIAGSTIKCVAVADNLRGEGLLPKLISHIISLHQGENLRVFTKPEYRIQFESLGFRLLASAPEAILLENGRGLQDYCDYLSSCAGVVVSQTVASRPLPPSGKPVCKQASSPAFPPVGPSLLRGRGWPRVCDTTPRTPLGVIVMNANPFTKGHKYLIDKALEEVEELVVIPVKEDAQEFTYEERKGMIEKACEGLPVTVAEGSDYSISAFTFPTYFLKDLSSAAEMQMRLDLDLFARHIVPALGASVRFVGTEPNDPLTARYNELMKEILPIPVVEVERLPGVSASRVRAGGWKETAAMTPASTHPYLLARLMHKAMMAELDTPLKPGLVGPDGNGAHSDMDYALMKRGADAIRRSFVAHIDLLPDLAAFGKAIEADALAATGGVNTHRGAIFALGLAACSALMGVPVGRLAAGLEQPEGTHGAEAPEAKGALKMAQGGYRELFEDWLPYYRSLEGDCFRMQKTLLKIMSGLDDTCIIHRAGMNTALLIKKESFALLDDFNEEKLINFVDWMNSGKVSPGGSADMLALTVFIQALNT